MQENYIQTRPCPECHVCGSEGVLAYHGLHDRLFGAPGEWNLKKCANPDCGTYWLDPMPIEEDIGKAYRTYHTHAQLTESRSFIRRFYGAARDGYLQARFGYTRGVGPKWYRYLRGFAYLNPGGASALDASGMFLPAPKPEATLLDVGCGGAQLLARMARMGWKAQGIDFDPNAVQAACSRGLQVSLGALEEQKFPDCHFDAIYMGHVIEHVHEPVRLLRECHRILKATGTLVVLTPNMESWGHQRYRDAWRGLEPPRHLHLFCNKSLSRLVERAGFSIRQVRTLATGSGILSMSEALRIAKGTRAELVFGATLLSRVKGHLYQIWERLLLAYGLQYAGEELAMIVAKGSRR